MIEISKWPWSLVSHNGPTVSENDDWSIYDADGKVICKEGFGSKEDHGNSKLIAHSPELLECLRSMVAMFDGGGSHIANWGAIAKSRSLLEKLDNEKDRVIEVCCY